MPHDAMRIAWELVNISTFHAILLFWLLCTPIVLIVALIDKLINKSKA